MEHPTFDDVVHVLRAAEMMLNAKHKHLAKWTLSVAPASVRNPRTPVRIVFAVTGVRWEEGVLPRALMWTQADAAFEHARAAVGNAAVALELEP
jgi:hypothetical protein